jgi:hypothetical protein
MIQHRHHNQISTTRDNQCNKLTSHEVIAKELIHYYKILLSEPQQDRKETIQNITKNIPRLVTQEHNESLLREINLT